MPRNYPDFLEAYVAAQRVSEAPEAAHLWSAIWSVAGALQRRVWFDGGGFTWTPNMYTILVGPPGVVQKSTTAGKASRLLAQVPGVVFGPASATWHGLIPKFNAAEQAISVDGLPFKISPLTMAVSELGSFLKLSQEGLDAVLIDMWDAQLAHHPWTHSTQTHGDKVVWNGALNLLGCTTLGWLRENVPASTLETGLISRVLFVYADQKRERISIPRLDPRWNRARQSESAGLLAADLCEIAKLRGPLEITPEAYTWQKAWYDGLELTRPAYMASERFIVYRSRKQSHVMKLAIVLTCAQSDAMVIGLDSVKKAVALVEDLERGIAHIFGVIGGPPEAQHVRQIVDHIREVATASGGPLSIRDLYRRLANVLTKREVDEAVVVAVETGQAQAVATGQKDPRGRPLPGLVALDPEKASDT